MPALLDSFFRRPEPRDPLLRNLGEQRASVAGRFDQKAAPALGGAIFGAAHAERRLSAPGSTTRHLNAFAGGDDAIDWVMDAVSLIAETAASAPTHFERDGKEVVANKTDDHAEDVEQAPGDLAALTSQPNSYMDWSELVYLTLVDYLLVGNGWWWLQRAGTDGKPLGIHRLHPAHVTIKQSKGGSISGYEYNPPGGGGKIIIPTHEMLHFRRPNPHDDHYGVGIIAGAPRMYDLELYLTEAQTDYFQKGTRLSGVLETDGNVSPALFEKLKRTFKSFYSGRENAYEVAVLERGLKYNAIGSNAMEAGFADLSEKSGYRILKSFRVPPSLLGLSGTKTGGSLAEDQRIFDNKTMRPLLDKFQKAISIGLTQAWGLDFVFEYEYLPPAEDQLELASVFSALPGVMLWEVRDKAGLAPLPNLPSGERDPRNDIVLNLPGENDNSSDVKDRPLAGEAGRPPNGENTASITEDLPADATARAKPDAGKVRRRQGRNAPVG